MADMLVKLFDLPSPAESERALSGQDIRIVRALAPDRSRIAQFAKPAADRTIPTRSSPPLPTTR